MKVCMGRSFTVNDIPSPASCADNEYQQANDCQQEEYDKATHSSSDDG